MKLFHRCIETFQLVTLHHRPGRLVLEWPLPVAAAGRIRICKAPSRRRPVELPSIRGDLDRWELEFGRPLSNGCFGENLTTTGLDVNAARIGERWRIGADVILEVSCPRIPCATFQGWLETVGWIEWFTRAAVPGPYLRIIEGGEIRHGDRIDVTHSPDHDVTVELAFRALTTEPDLLSRLLVADALPRPALQTIRRRVGRG